MKLILTAAIVGTALALPSVSNAAPPAPTFQDSVSLPESFATFEIPPQTYEFTELIATSGPNGETPTGQVAFLFSIPGTGTLLSDGGPVTCLAVSGNSATLNYQSGFLPPLEPIVTLRVVDNNPDTVSFFVAGRAATDCSPPPPTTAYPLTSGDVKVVDAQPPPTTTDQCKGDGWKQFGFNNQGLCLAFVERGP